MEGMGMGWWYESEDQQELSNDRTRVVHTLFFPFFPLLYNFVMLNEEDVLGNGFLDPDASRYLLSSTTSSSINRSLSMPLQLGNPWNTDSQFEPVVSDLGQHSTTAAVDDDILGAGVTAASVLGKSYSFIYHWTWQTHHPWYSGYRPSRNIQPCLSTSSSHRRTGDPGFIGKSNCFGWITTKDGARGNQSHI